MPATSTTSSIVLDSLKCFLQAIFEQCLHAGEARLPPQDYVRLPAESQFANGVIHRHQFEDPKPAPEAR